MRILGIIFFFVINLLQLYSQDQFGDVKIYNNGEIFYEKAIDTNLVNKLGQFFVDSYFFDGTPRSVQFLDDGINYIIKIIVNDSMLTNKEYLKQVSFYTSQISENVLNFAPVDIHLSNPFFITKKIVKHYRIGNKIKLGNDDIYYLPDFNTEKAKEFAQYLKDAGFLTNDGKTVQFRTLNDILIFAYPVEPGYENNQEYISIVYEFAEQISKEYYNNGKVIIYLTDLYFDELRAVSNF